MKIKLLFEWKYRSRYEVIEVSHSISVNELFEYSVGCTFSLLCSNAVESLQVFLILSSVLVKKPDLNEVVNKTSIYNKTVYVGNLPDQIAGE